MSFIFSFVLQQKRVRVWRQTTFERNFYPGNVMARLSRGAKGRCVFYFVSFVRCPDIRRTSFSQFPVLYSSMKYSIDAVCKFLAPGFRLWRPRRFALGTRPARCRRRILESRERRFAFPSGWETLLETGMVIQERHTAPVGAKPAFLQALGTSCACCRRRSRAERPDANHLM